MNFEFPIGVWFKLVIILLLFVCGIILLLLEKRNKFDINYLESGIGNNVKNKNKNRIVVFAKAKVALASVIIISIYGAYVSFKINEAKIITASNTEGDQILPINNIIEDEDIKKSFFLYGFLNKFEVLDVFSKLAISLLIFNSLIFSCVISIIFVFFGDYLLERFKIEVKYPKLAEIIKLRRKFQKYYLIFNILMILSVVIIEVIFSIAVLLL